MNFQPVLLWTDLLFFALLLVALATVLHVRRNEPLRAAWRKVGRRPTGMAAATVLVIFWVPVFFVLVSSLFGVGEKPADGEAGQ